MHDSCDHCDHWQTQPGSDRKRGFKKAGITAAKSPIHELVPRLFGDYLFPALQPPIPVKVGAEIYHLGSDGLVEANTLACIARLVRDECRGFASVRPALSLAPPYDHKRWAVIDAVGRVAISRLRRDLH